MPEALDTNTYARVLLIDTQVVLETRPLDQLPWTELGQGPILLLVCRTVQSEIDAKKGDGRLGERSRAFNRLLDRFLETRFPVALRLEGPKVDVALLRNASIDWTALDDLDRDDADDRIVAQGLNALVDDRARLELLSHDMRPRDAAASHGMRTVKLPEHWLREPAQTPDQREVARLRQELRTATADQPRLEVELMPLGDAQWARPTIELPTEAEITRVRDVILERNPRPDEEAWPSGRIPGDHDWPERHDGWRRRLSRVHLPAMHLGLSRILSQRRARIVVRNVGSISAEGLAVEVRSGNATLHANPYRVLVFGDAAPRYENPMMRVNRMIGGGLRSPRREEPFTVYRELEDPGPVLSWSCRSFRQERVLTIDISVEVEERTGVMAQIEAVVTASNLKGDVRTRALVPVEQSRSRFSETYDVEQGALVTPPAYLPAAGGEDDEITRFHNDGSVAD